MMCLDSILPNTGSASDWYCEFIEIEHNMLLAGSSTINPQNIIIIVNTYFSSWNNIP